jgi:hypothetical protein
VLDNIREMNGICRDITICRMLHTLMFPQLAVLYSNLPRERDVAMQSWQTDLLNLYLRTTVKPLLRHARSVRTVRRAMTLSDKTAGRLMIPRHTHVARAVADSVDCRCDWIDTPASQSERVILYLPGGAYISRTPHLHTAIGFPYLW